LLGRNEFKIERKTKLLIAIWWNWTTLIPMVRLFQNKILTLWIFFLIVKNESRNESCNIFFQKDAMIASKIKLSITFTITNQMEWIKASHVYINTINFLLDFFLPLELKFMLMVP